MQTSELVVPFSYIVVILQAIYVGLFLHFESVIPVQPATLHSRVAYRVLHDYVRQNENTILLSGSIFVTGAVILLGQTAVTNNENVRVALVFGSWLLYLTWLFLFQLFSVRLAHRAYERLRHIESQVGIQAYQYMSVGRSHIRRWVWLALLEALLIVGVYLLVSETRVILIVCVVEAIVFVVASFSSYLLQANQRTETLSCAKRGGNGTEQSV